MEDCSAETALTHPEVLHVTVNGAVEGLNVIAATRRLPEDVAEGQEVAAVLPDASLISCVPAAC